MRIATSVVQFNASHTYEKSETVHVSRNLTTQSENGGSDVLVSNQGKRLSEASRSFSMSGTTEVIEETESGDDTISQMITAMISHLTGRSVSVSQSISARQSAVNTTEKASNTGNSMTESIWMQVTEKYMLYEEETLSVQSKGVLSTEDVREISFDLNLTMNRSYSLMESSESSVEASRLIDPIVITVNGEPPQFGDTFFTFDMDGDGSEETFSTLENGAGFLSLDKNGDGRINDGNELFGPNTGNGFSELADYDSDGNGWIDENDAVFEQLTVWSRDADGNDRMVSLKEAGIGAIYLGSAETPFQFTDDSNLLQGQLSRTGILVRENGIVHQIYQMDLAEITQDTLDSRLIDLGLLTEPSTDDKGASPQSDRIYLGLRLQDDEPDYFSPAQKMLDKITKQFKKLAEQLKRIRNDQSNEKSHISNFSRPYFSEKIR